MELSRNRSFRNVDYRVVRITVITLFATLLLTSIYFFSKGNLIIGLVIPLIPVPFYFLYIIFKQPRLGFIAALFCNYFAIGIGRYLPAPLGLTVDGTLLLTFIALLFSQFNHKVEWKLAGKDYTVWVVIWALMTLMQLFNPEAVSREAWFYAMRGYALYSVFTVPLVYLIFNRPKDLDLLITLLAWFAIIAVAKGIGQKYIGLDQWEHRWLMTPGNRITHMLFGKLRVFSVLSDAGTFGGTMGYFGILFLILGMHETRKRKKRFYFFVGIFALYGMLISGTRSAIAVPLTGFAVYTILVKNFKVMTIGGILLFGIFFFLKYTSIGQDNYDIRRMRSGFDENNPSMILRNQNRKIFADYLATRPFGGGVGSAGNWGLRFSPGTILAETATDGWYIQIWAEQGVVGLIFYLCMMLYFGIKSCFIIFFRLKKPEYKYKAIGFTCGLFGLMVSSYTSASLGQMPNTVIVFASLTIISLMPGWEKEEESKTKVIVAST